MDGVDNLSELRANPKNPRRISDFDFKNLVNSIKEFGDLSCVVYNVASSQLVGGHQRVQAFKALDGDKKITYSHRHYNEPDGVGEVARGYILVGDQKFPYREVNWPLDATDPQGNKYSTKEYAANIAANRIQGEFDVDLLAEISWQLSEDAPDILKLSGQSDEEIKDLLRKVSGEEPEPHGNLADDFIVPPFSILDTKQAYWQRRKDEWLSLGIKSELGRKDVGSISDNAQNGLNKIAGTGFNGGTSIFDPVLCEIMYRWFNVAGGQVLDPFAGGSVRGIVASQLGMPYVGIDLRDEQLAANREQAMIIDCNPMPVWIAGDSMDIVAHAGTDFAADFVFSCPPYADLEVYSDKPADLSNMEYEQFCSAYWDIIARSCGLLKDNRFAAFVVSEVRDKKGIYRNLVGDTIQAFLDAGLSYYNEMILVNAAGTLPLRAGKQFNAGRKVGRQHQNVLVFYKGDPKLIKDSFKELDFSKLETDDPAL